MSPFALLLSAAFYLGAVSAHDFSICSGVSDKIGVTGVSLSPDPPVGGQDLKITISGTPTVDVTGGTLSATIKVLGIQIASVDFDVCKDLGITCPAAKGKALSGSFTYTIPSAAPSGVTASVEATVKDTSSNELTCVDMSVKVGSTYSATSPMQNLRSTASSSMSRKSVEFLFESWRKEHGFVHDFKDAEEFVKRMDIFGDNIEKIIAHNNHHKHSWTMSMNEFGHLTGEEFKAKYTGLNKKRPVLYGDVERDVHTAEGVLKSDLSDSVDWTSKGAVTAVKNQGQCGSCWAFSTTGSLEGAYYLKNGDLKSFSEQQLVSCDTIDSGCNGGLMDNAFGWIESNGGICSEDDYPYTSSGGTAASCKNTCTAVSGSTPTKYTDVSKSETALMSAVEKQPVSIAIEADQSAFQFYNSGVMTGTCGTNLDHGVLVVGYGTDDGTDYWKVKNSWGATWGMDGYILLERGKSQSGGQCGLLNSASYPTL